MRRPVFCAIGIVGIGLLAACSQADEPTPFEEEASAASLAEILASRTGARIFMLKAATGAGYGYVAATDGRRVFPPKPTSDDLRAFVVGLGDSSGLGVDLDTAPVGGELHGDGGGTAVRFGRVVPGTTVPVFDSAVVLATREDGTFAYLESDPIAGLEKLDVRPSIDAASASRTASGRGSSEAIVPEPPVLGVLTTDAGPVLAYRVEVVDGESSLRVHVDAKSGAVVSEGKADTHALAYSAASYYADTDPRRIPQATLECGITNGHLVRQTRGGDGGALRYSAHVSDRRHCDRRRRRRRRERRAAGRIQGREPQAVRRWRRRGRAVQHGSRGRLLRYVVGHDLRPS